MTITYTTQKAAEYEDFKKNGGTIAFEIDPEEISPSMPVSRNQKL